MCGGFALFLEQTHPEGGKVRARLPAKPMNSVSERNPGPEEKRKVNNLFIRKTYLKARAFMVE